VEHPSEDEREDIDVPDDAYYGAAAGSSDHNTYGGSYGSAGGDIELPRITYSEGMRRFNERTRQVLQQIHEEEEEEQQKQQQQQRHGQPAAPPKPGVLDLAADAGAAAAAGGPVAHAAGYMHWHAGPPPAATAGAAAGSELQQHHCATYGNSYDNRVGGYGGYAASAALERSRYQDQVSAAELKISTAVAGLNFYFPKSSAQPAAEARFHAYGSTHSCHRHDVLRILPESCAPACMDSSGRCKARCADHNDASASHPLCSLILMHLQSHAFLVLCGCVPLPAATTSPR
jgi:hypothetical protein